MKNQFLIYFLLFSTTGKLLAQDAEPSKNNFGATLSTNLFGLNDDLNHVAVGGGFYFSRKITNKFSIYSELVGSWRNYGDVAISPNLSGEFTTGNLAIYIGPMVDIGKRMSISVGFVQNYLFNSELKTETVTYDISAETRNYSSLYFDLRTSIYKEVSLGTRYEWGINSIFKNSDRKVSTISFNMFLPLRGKRNQEKNK
jgi:hypothetical protein